MKMTREMNKEEINQIECVMAMATLGEKICKNHEQIVERKQVMPEMNRAIVKWIFSRLRFLVEEEEKISYSQSNKSISFCFFLLR